MPRAFVMTLFYYFYGAVCDCSNNVVTTKQTELANHGESGGIHIFHNLVCNCNRKNLLVHVARMPKIMKLIFQIKTLTVAVRNCLDSEW